jgi:RNA recognition motif-containing protein
MYNKLLTCIIITSQYSQNDKFCKIVSIKIITDKFSGRSKGFGFVEMETEEQEELAIKECNRCVVSGRSIVVSKAHSRKGYEPK